MVRAKGGKRQPRYYDLKNAGAEKLVRCLSDLPTYSRVDRMIMSMVEMNNRTEELLEKWR